MSNDCWKMPVGLDGNELGLNKKSGPITRQGYRLIKTGKGKWELEHRIVWAAYNGPIPDGKGNHVHHINGDKLDNRLENLDLVRGGKHLAIHREERGGSSRTSIRIYPVCCLNCGSWRLVPSKHQDIKFCNRTCAKTYDWKIKPETQGRKKRSAS